MSSHPVFTLEGMVVAGGILSPHQRKVLLAKIAESLCQNMNEYNQTSLDICGRSLAMGYLEKLTPETLLKVITDLYTLQRKMKEAMDGVLAQYQ